MKLTLATKITIARIFLIIPTVILFVLGMVYQADSTLYAVFMALSSFLFVFLCVTDILDGHIARKKNIVTDFGTDCKFFCVLEKREGKATVSPL